MLFEVTLSLTNQDQVCLTRVCVRFLFRSVGKWLSASLVSRTEEINTTKRRRRRKNRLLVWSKLAAVVHKSPWRAVYGLTRGNDIWQLLFPFTASYSDRFSAIQTSLGPSGSSAAAQGMWRLDGQCLQPGLGTMTRGALGAHGGPPGIPVV